MTAQYLPIEAVRRLADLPDIATLLRLDIRHARIERLASWELTPHGFVAIVAYEEPGSPGRHEVPVRLSLVPMETCA